MVKLYRKRYLLFKTYTPQGRVDWSNVKDAIFESFEKLFGIAGLSQADLAFIHYDEEQGLGVVRCSHKLLDNVRASIAFVQKAGGKEVSLNVLKVSGTIKKLKEAIAKN